MLTREPVNEVELALSVLELGAIKQGVGEVFGEHGEEHLLILMPTRLVAQDNGSRCVGQA